MRALRDGFRQDIRSRLPVAQLREKYTHQEVASLLQSNGLEFYPLAHKRHAVQYDHAGWAMDLLAWFFDECLPGSGTRLSPHTQQRWFSYLLPCGWSEDWPSLAVFDFLLTHGVRPLTWKGVLGLAVRSAVDKRFSVCARLLDAGAYDEECFGQEQQVKRWYQSRQACRCSCVAFLALAKHSPLLRQCVPRDVRLMIARTMWQQRFVAPVPLDAPPPTRPKRRRK